jgi:hypothetical protein
MAAVLRHDHALGARLGTIPILRRFTILEILEDLQADEGEAS